MNYFKFSIGLYLLCTLGTNIYSMELIFHQKKGPAGEPIKNTLIDHFRLIKKKPATASSKGFKQCIESYRCIPSHKFCFSRLLYSVFDEGYELFRQEKEEEIGKLKEELETIKQHGYESSTNWTKNTIDLQNKLKTARVANIGFFCFGSLIGGLSVYYLSSLLKK